MKKLQEFDKVAKQTKKKKKKKERKKKKRKINFKVFS